MAAQWGTATSIIPQKGSFPMYALIMAGGSGTRLWPHSRSHKPKQFLPINSQSTMLQETVIRILPLIPIDRVYVVTGEIYADLVREQLPDLPAENLLIEPSGKGTAPAIGLGALHIRQRDPEAIMAVLSADHGIEEQELFRQQLAVGATMAEQGFLVTLGIKPSSPATGYGYIESGELLYASDGQQVFRVKRFVEKPTLERAQGYVASGTFYWNAGMFVWSVSRILSELARFEPLLSQGLTVINSHLKGYSAKRVLEDVWPNMPNIAIDVAVMERTERAVVIPADIGWNDVGDWAALADILPQDSDGNTVRGTSVSIDTRNTLIYGNGRLVATIGIEDLVIVDTHDVLLICPRERAQDVKAMVAEIRKQHGSLA
jgi:mannose-1-phosphate guanylyltransferase